MRAPTINLRRQAAFIIAEVRERGSDADDLRDAAHEATHAFQAELKLPWRRATIHDALCTKIRTSYGRQPIDILFAALMRYEVIARAAEQLVCKQLDVDIDPIETWGANAVLEAAMLGIKAEPAWFFAKVHTATKQRQTLQLVKRVLALGERS